LASKASVLISLSPTGIGLTARNHTPEGLLVTEPVYDRESGKTREWTRDSFPLAKKALDRVSNPAGNPVAGARRGTFTESEGSDG